MPLRRPRPSSFDLSVSAPARPRGNAGRRPVLPWLAIASLGSAASVLLGWLIVSLSVSVGWLTDTAQSPGVVGATIGQLWLAAHGVPVVVGGVTVAIAPLGLSLLLVAALGVVASYSGAQRLQEGGVLSPRHAARVVGVVVSVYVGLVWLVASVVGRPGQPGQALLGALAVASLGALLGVGRWLAWERTPAWPAAAVPGSVAGLMGLALGSAATLGLAVASHADAVSALGVRLGTDPVTNGLVMALTLAYLPNALLWAGSYALGGGLTLGTGTLLTPWVSNVGALPILPLAGAVPPVPPAHGWALLALGPLAGLVAGLSAGRRLRRRTGRVHPAAATWAGLATWAGTLLPWVAASAWSRGGLGQGHLQGLGPRLPELVAWAAPALALGIASGLIWVVWRTRGVVVEPPSDAGEAPAKAEVPLGAVTPVDPGEATLVLDPNRGADEQPR